ncbi:hypothetical protein ACQR1W_01890 [Bradyrhizobium sp. HKCCYLS1011]|uniref:hypothetical protein n=1 Tax=Bradyrhizobium sp. HKCCYLS1011 TaxID=3420733 RepID=UPI003EBBBFF5
MVLTFQSTIAESFELIGTDARGRRRIATASKAPQDFYWQLELRHPSGDRWEGRYHGNSGVLDALAELLNSRDQQFKQDAARGDRPRADLADPNRAVNEAVAPITRSRA